MELLIPQLVTLVSGGVVVLQALLIAGILFYLFTNKSPLHFLPTAVANHLMLVALFVTIGMAVLTLFFEYVAGFEPCMLCWWQRVCMFPQIVLLSLALWKKEAERLIDYCLALSGIGLLIGIYNYVLLYMPSLAPCSATGVSCAKVHFVEFGYVTFPMWAITGFVLLICLLLLAKYKQQ